MPTLTHYRKQAGYTSIRAFAEAALIGKLALGALHQPSERVIWISACGYGPYTSISLPTLQQDIGCTNRR